MTNASASLIAGQRPGAVRAWRNRNPGNLRPPARRVVKAFVSGVDNAPGGPFLIYTTEADGWHDLCDLLLQYRSWGWVTLSKIIGSFAPASDGNNPTWYARMVMEGLGWVKPGENPPAATMTQLLARQVDVRDPVVMEAITRMISVVEGAPLLGGPKSPAWSPDERAAGFAAAGINLVQQGA